MYLQSQVGGDRRSVLLYGTDSVDGGVDGRCRGHWRRRRRRRWSPARPREMTTAADCGVDGNRRGYQDDIVHGSHPCPQLDGAAALDRR
jgi:hypothetical protein